jgi:hypothetical protein
MPLGLGFFAAAGGGAAAPAFELIQTQVLTGDTTSVSFASIPQTFTHLQLRIVARGATTLNEIGTRRIALRLQLDPTNSYSAHEFFGNGNNVFSQAATNQTFIWAGSSIGDGAPANAYSASVVDILDYSSTTKNKTVRTLTGNQGGTNGQNNIVNLQSGTRYSLGAVAFIDLLTEGSFAHGFRAGSRFSLYGIRG